MNKWLELLRSNDYLSMKKYIKSGADLSVENETGESVLACAMRERCDEDIVNLLIESGADLYAFDDEGVSVFDMAITYNNCYVVNYLIEQGIDINRTTRRSGFTPLMCAVCYGRVEIVQILLKNGADQNARDAKGFNAIDFARKMNKKTLLKLLDYDEDAPQNRDYAR